MNAMPLPVEPRVKRALNRLIGAAELFRSTAHEDGEDAILTAEEALTGALDHARSVLAEAA